MYVSGDDGLADLDGISPRIGFLQKASSETRDTLVT